MVPLGCGPREFLGGERALLFSPGGRRGGLGESGNEGQPTNAKAGARSYDIGDQSRATHTSDGERDCVHKSSRHTNLACDGLSKTGRKGKGREVGGGVMLPHCLVDGFIIFDVA